MHLLDGVRNLVYIPSIILLLFYICSKYLKCSCVQNHQSASKLIFFAPEPDVVWVSILSAMSRTHFPPNYHRHKQNHENRKAVYNQLMLFLWGTWLSWLVVPPTPGKTLLPHPQSLHESTVYVSEAGWRVRLGSPFKVKDRVPFLMICQHADVQPMLMFACVNNLLCQD